MSGIDVDSSRNVLIEHTYIDTGDDAIALKSGEGKPGQDFGAQQTHQHCNW